MKKLLLWLICLFSLCGIQQSSSAMMILPSAEFYPASWTDLKLSEFVRLSEKDFARISGVKLNLKQRILLPYMKLKMKRSIKKGGDITVGTFLNAQKKLAEGWRLLLVILALLLFIGLIFALAISNSL